MKLLSFHYFSTVIIEIGVTSEPVPAVVGIKTKGSLGPLAFSTPQTSSKSSFDPRIKATNFAISIDDPPPKPITPVALKDLASSIASKRVLREGSASTLSNILTCEFFSSSKL